MRGQRFVAALFFVGVAGLLFVHGVDANDVILAQADGQPRDGDYPTSFWEPGDVVRDMHRLMLPARYARLRVGWYRAETGERLKRVGPDGDALELEILR